LKSKIQDFKQDNKDIPSLEYNHSFCNGVGRYEGAFLVLSAKSKIELRSKLIYDRLHKPSEQV
jgi:hypothetical protein